METKKGKSNSRLLLVVILVILALTGWLMYDWTQLRSQNQQLQTELEEVSSEKANVKSELADLLVEYEGMKTNNDSLNSQLKAEQEKIQELLEEVKKVKASNAYKIARYKKEAKTLRKIMRSFVQQIDSLNTLNKQLTARVEKTESKYRHVVKEKEDLVNKSDSLSSQVELASTLKADGITIQALNERGNKTSRARKAVKVEICFTIRDNAVAAAGNKNIHLRIADPKGNILTNSQMGFFMSEGKELAYSASRKVNYTGKKTQACLYFDAANEFESGSFSVDLFEDGKKIGVSTFKLR